MPAGYSGTPLPQKLGITASTRLYLFAAPQEYPTLLGPLPFELAVTRTPTRRTDMAHVFVTRREDLETQLRTLRTKLGTDAVVWVSWPKKTSKIPSTVTEGTVRELALPLGYVDVKVCAVSETWSGLKLVVRKELR